MFKNREIVIATMHKKEQVLQSKLENELGVSAITISDFNTDVFGTFSGETKRKESALKTAREKCFKAMEISNCTLAIASEGSFGPHPNVFFAQANEEILVFIDKENNLEVVAATLSLNTNFNAKYVISEKELLDFSMQVNFPSHGIILSQYENDTQTIFKGITSQVNLLDTYYFLMKNYGKVYAQTDMRALYNPTRMEVIGETLDKLLLKINSHCPECNFPGFDIVDIKLGLPCEWCKNPTSLVFSEVYTCKKCNFQKEELYPKKIQYADPQYCDHCNP